MFESPLTRMLYLVRMSKPKDTLSPALVIKDLKTRFVGQRIIYHPALTSTMDVARAEAKRGAVEGTIIVADEQIAGRGRLQRVWLSPSGNIALSVILRPTLPCLPSLTMLASLAVAHSIEAVTALKPRLKWPNDVLIGGKKVCGILIESNARSDKVDYAIIGIGINVNLRLEDYPEILPIATSLSHELKKEVSRLNLLRHLLVEIEKLYLAISAGQSIFEEWRDSLVTIGKKVRVKSGDAVQEGIAESVTPDGSLLLRRPDGTLSKILAGDVTLQD
jgi:BirA family biotin operon repressor/biotin-[acetyl-CoA-carboxylase] ligase